MPNDVPRDWRESVVEDERVTDYDQYAELYDVAFADVDEDLSFWRHVDGDRSRILEIGCGTGRLVPSLTEGTGVQYLGVDPSPEMLRRAKTKYRAVDFAQGHLGALPVEDSWAMLACCTRGSLAHVITYEDLLAAMGELRRVVHERGSLIIDVPFYSANDDIVLGPVELRELKTASLKGKTYKLYFESEWRDLTRHIVVKQHIAELDDGGSIVRAVTVQLSTKVFTVFELNLLLTGAGFRVQQIYGSYELEPLGPDSTRLIVVATPISGSC